MGRHCTVLAVSSAIGFVVYAEAETRAVMDAGHPQTNIGLVDLEINRLAKVRQKPYGGLKADLVCLLDSVHGYIRPVSRTRRPQWFPRSGTYTSSGGTRSSGCVFSDEEICCAISLKCWFVLFPSLHWAFAIHFISWIIPFISCSPDRSPLYSPCLDPPLSLVLQLHGVYSILEFDNLDVVPRKL